MFCEKNESATFGFFFTLFALNVGKQEFSSEKQWSGFLNIPILQPSIQKNYGTKNVQNRFRGKGKIPFFDPFSILLPDNMIDILRPSRKKT